MNFRDVELLSAYLDGRLSPSEAARLEGRISSDPNLKATLEDLRETRGLLRRLPQRKAPRNFRLTPKMVGIRPPEPRAYPAFRLATALAAFLLLASVALNAFTPFAAQRLAAAPAPIYGMGGGGGGGGAPESSTDAVGGGGSGQFTEVPPAATEAPLQQPFAAAAPTATLEGTAAAESATSQALQTEDTARASGAAPETQANKIGPIQPGSPLATNQPVPIPWIIGFAVVMIVCAVAAWLLRRNNERRIRKQWSQK